MADIMATPNPEGSLLNAPALPARSSMRSSKLFDSLAVKNAMADQQPPLSPATAPHDVYLSSEEDASSSADDFSDYEFSSESEFSQGSPALGPQQATARVVSVIFHGKPSLVNLSPRSTSPTSSISTSTSAQIQQPRQAPIQQLQRTSTVSDMDYKRSSIASTASSTFFNFSRSSTVTFGASSTNKPSFLSIDPFASKSSSRESDELDRPRTPTAILKRKLTLSKKRSKPALNNNNDGGSQPREGAPSRPVSLVHAEAEGRMHERRPSTPQPSVNYQDIMRAARRTAQSTPPPPTPPPAPESKPSTMGGKRSRLRNLSISRKLSVKP